MFWPQFRSLFYFNNRNSTRHPSLPENARACLAMEAQISLSWESHGGAALKDHQSPDRELKAHDGRVIYLSKDTQLTADRVPGRTHRFSATWGGS